MGSHRSAKCARVPHPHPGPPLEGEGDFAWLNIVANQVSTRAALPELAMTTGTGAVGLLAFVEVPEGSIVGKVRGRLHLQEAAIQHRRVTQRACDVLSQALFALLLDLCRIIR